MIPMQINMSHEPTQPTQPKG